MVKNKDYCVKRYYKSCDKCFLSGSKKDCQNNDIKNEYKEELRENEIRGLIYEKIKLESYCSSSLLESVYGEIEYNIASTVLDEILDIKNYLRDYVLIKKLLLTENARQQHSKILEIIENRIEIIIGAAVERVLERERW